MKLKYFALWRDSSLRRASFRMTRLYILLMISNLFQWENCVWIAKIFFWIAFLSELRWRKFIRCKARWNMMRDRRCELKGASISITKFTEMWWNDGFFEGSEEHWSSKSGDFAQRGAGWGMMWRYGDMVREKTKCAKFCWFVNGYKPFSNWN